MESTLVRFEELSALQHRQVQEISLSKAQKVFVGDIEGALMTLAARPAHDIQGYVVLVAGIPRGFFLLRRRSLLPDWAQAQGATATLHALMIDRRFQRQGLGSECMRGLPDLVRACWPDIEQLMLAVDPANDAAVALYQKQGWQAKDNAGRGRTDHERCMVMTIT